MPRVARRMAYRSRHITPLFFRAAVLVVKLCHPNHLGKIIGVLVDRLPVVRNPVGIASAQSPRQSHQTGEVRNH